MAKKASGLQYGICEERESSNIGRGLQTQTVERDLYAETSEGAM